MRFAPWGHREVWLALALHGASLAVLAYGGLRIAPWLWALAVLPASLLGLTLWFFRDPERATPDGPGLFVSPADGVVTHVETVKSVPFVNEASVRISIFMSVFDVHVNRAPCDGRAAYFEHRPGGYGNVMFESAAAANEAHDLGMETDDPRAPRVLVRQIAGLVARRIVCDLEPGQALRRGERFGMIKFSSRVDLFVPASSGFRPRVEPGTVVKAGLTVLGELA